MSHEHTENGCLYCMIIQLYDKIEDLKEEKRYLEKALSKYENEKTNNNMVKATFI